MKKLLIILVLTILLIPINTKALACADGSHRPSCDGYGGNYNGVYVKDGRINWEKPTTTHNYMEEINEKNDKMININTAILAFIAFGIVVVIVSNKKK